MAEVLGKISPELAPEVYAARDTYSESEVILATTALSERLGRTKQEQACDEELQGIYIVELDDGKKVTVAY